VAYSDQRYNLTDSPQGYMGLRSRAFPNRAAAEVAFYGGVGPTFGRLTLDYGVLPARHSLNAAIDCPGQLRSAYGPPADPTATVIKADASFWEIYGPTGARPSSPSFRLFDQGQPQLAPF
jgi:hypothetical protein